MTDLEKVSSILASEIECSVFEKHVLPALGTARKVLAAAPAAPAQSGETVATVYAECNECAECGHIGINDSHNTDASCGYSCGWTGPSPVEDKCPGCQREGVMGLACPKCSGRYSILAEAHIAAPQANQPAKAGEACEHCKTNRPYHDLDCPVAVKMMAAQSAVVVDGERAALADDEPAAWECASPTGERPALAFLTSKKPTLEHYESQGWRVTKLYTASSISRLAAKLIAERDARASSPQATATTDDTITADTEQKKR